MTMPTWSGTPPSQSKIAMSPGLGGPLATRPVARSHADSVGTYATPRGVDAGAVPPAAEHDAGADVEAVRDEDRAPGDAVDAEPAAEHRPVRARRRLPHTYVPQSFGQRTLARALCHGSELTTNR